jgi:regulator of replication initiation timing
MVGMGIVDNFKDLFKIADAANNVDLYKKLSELQTRVMELEDDNRQLRDEKSQLQQTLDLREKMYFKEPFYYQDGDETAFCPACFESNKHEAVHVVFESTNSEATYWRCPACQTDYRIPKNRLAPHPRSFNPGGGGSQSWMGG